MRQVAAFLTVAGVNLRSSSPEPGWPEMPAISALSSPRNSSSLKVLDRLLDEVRRRRSRSKTSGILDVARDQEIQIEQDGAFETSVPDAKKISLMF